MEINGIINLHHKLDRLVKSGELAAARCAELQADLQVLNRYLTAYFYCRGVAWHSVRDYPDEYPTGGEVHEKLKAALEVRSDNFGKAEMLAIIRSCYPSQQVREEEI